MSKTIPIDLLMATAEDIVTILITEQPVKCSRRMLIKNSEYFKAMFSGRFIESENNEIRLKGVEKRSFSMIINSLRDPDYVIDDHHILQMLETANMYQFVEVENKCASQILKTLSAENCLNLWFFTENMNITGIFLKAKLISLLEFEKVRKSKDFFRLTVTQMKRYLGNIHLRGSEIDVFDSIVEWFQKSNLTDPKVLNELILCVDLNSLKDDQLDKITDRCRVLKYNDLICLMVTLKERKKGVNTNPHVSKSQEFAELFNCSRRRNVEGHPYIFTFNNNISQVRSIVTSLKMKPFLVDMPNRAPVTYSFLLRKHMYFAQAHGGGLSRVVRVVNPIVLHYYFISEKYKFSYLMKPCQSGFIQIEENCINLFGGVSDDRSGFLDIEFFDITTSLSKVCLPGFSVPQYQIKCCVFKGEAIFLDINRKCTLRFLRDVRKFHETKIEDPSDILPKFSRKIFLFSYKNHLYIKENKLFKLRLEGDNWLIVETHDIPGTPDYWKPHFIVCHNTLFIIETLKKKEYCLKTLDLDTLEIRNCFTTGVTFEIMGIFKALLPCQLAVDHLINPALTKN